MSDSNSPHSSASGSATMIEPASQPTSHCEGEGDSNSGSDCPTNQPANPIQPNSNRNSNSNPNPNPNSNSNSNSNPKSTPNPSPSTKPTPDSPAKQSRTRMLCRQTARTDEPTPWLMSKIAIPIVLGTVAYSAYVILATLIIPALAHLHSTAPLSSSEAIPLTITLCVAWLMFLWSYLRVCLTPAGFVKDHHQPSSPPANLLSPNPSLLTSSTLSRAVPYSDHPIHPLSPHLQPNPPSPSPSLIPTPPHSLPASLVVSPRQSTEHDLPGPAQVEAIVAADGLSPRMVARRLAVPSPAETHDTSLTKVDGTPQLANRTVAAAEPPPLLAALHRPMSSMPVAERPDGSILMKEESSPSPVPPSPPPTCTAIFSPPRTPKIAPPPPPAPTDSLVRIPPSVDIHDPATRYCRKCRTVKSLRAHHCRHCGTCVLKMDHHCPWVGRCVGARNYKFFYNFLVWSTIYCTHIFLVLLIVNVRVGRPSGGVNRHQAAILALSGLFMLFTGSLLLTHTYLIMHNLSTIEHLAIERHRRREKRAIARALSGTGGRKWAAACETRRVVRKLDSEWGSFVREGNVWFLGWRRNWESVMGRWQVGWILPIRALPRTEFQEEGLCYDVNPRCDDRGRWRPRREWPVELQ